MAVQSTSPSPSLAKRVWTPLMLLGFAGQLAWAPENHLYNTSLYDNIIPDPRPIPWMVAARAITATVTTILMGALSNRTCSRWGRRRPFILLGYLAWGLLTILFPAAALFQPVALAVAMAILPECLTTFFGSTANDAALQAYVTDVTSLANRGRVSGALEIMTWIALTILAGGILLADRWGRRPVALLAAILEVAGLLLFSFARSILVLALTGILWPAPLTARTIATGAWSKDLFPKEKRGQFAGYYPLFWMAVPMVLGPSWSCKGEPSLISTAG